MSDVEISNSEASSFKEDSKLVSKSEKQKHASATEKDDANLLSEGSSQEDDEEELVLEYSDAAKISGEFKETVDFEDGHSTSASEDEITGLTEERQEYIDTSAKLAKLVSIEGEDITEDVGNSQREANGESDVPKDDKISQIAEALSTQMALEEKDKDPKEFATPGKATPKSVTEESPPNDKDIKKKKRHCRRKSSSSSMSDSGRFSTSKKDGRVSSHHSSNDELEWDEEYQFDQAPITKKTGSKSQGNDEERQRNLLPIVKTPERNKMLADSKETSFVEDKQANGNIKTGSKALKKSVTVEGVKSSSRESSKTVRSTEKGTERPRSEPPSTKAVDQSLTGHKKQAKETKKRSSSGRSKKSGKRTRYKIYLDDPDIHQCIADYSNILRKFASEIETGKYVPNAENRLHPLSRDDIFEDNSKKRGSKKRGVSKSTSMEQPQRGSKSFQPVQQSRSAGHLGPYDGHGKRGRNLIARIKGLSESSSSSPDDDDVDEDELTNARITKSRVRKDKGPRKDDLIYDVCSECGERHSPDDDSDENTDQEVCPDCGVPHNPFQHPPSPSAKNKWRQYVEHCRKAMLQISSASYQQVPQDPPEPSREETLPIVLDKESVKPKEDSREINTVNWQPLKGIEGPHTTEELRVGARYKMKYLGTTQVITQHPVTKETRMEQAQEAYARIKVPEDEVQPATDTEIIISLERIKVVNCEGKNDDIMMDHALRTVCFICDIGDILVLMSRRLTTDLPDVNIEEGNSNSLKNLLSEREKRTSKNICHIFQCEEAQKISKAIGQAFNMAYRQFLKSNGISHDNVEEAEYCNVLESQKIVGQDLDLLADSNNTRDVVLQKKRGEPLGLMLLESGWGSMLPTVFVAHIAIYSPAARLGGQISVGDHVLSCNGASLVGLPLSECNTVLRNTRSSARVILRIVSCPPVVDVVVSRPDTKFQLGFSVQNGTICSLLRGGIAERGGVRVGHRIIEINGESVVAKSHQHIVDILATTSGEISMKTLPVAMYRLMVGVDTPVHV